MTVAEMKTLEPKLRSALNTAVPSAAREVGSVAKVSTAIGVNARPKPKPCSMFVRKTSRGVMLRSSCAIHTPAIACAASPVMMASRGRYFVNGTTIRNEHQLPTPRAVNTTPMRLSG